MVPTVFRICTDKYLFVDCLPYIQRFRCRIGMASVFVLASTSQVDRQRIEVVQWCRPFSIIIPTYVFVVDCLPHVRRFRRRIGTTSVFVPASTSQVGRHRIEGHSMVPPYSVIVPTYVFVIDCLPHVRRFRRRIGTTSVFVPASTS